MSDDKKFVLKVAVVFIVCAYLLSLGYDYAVKHIPVIVSEDQKIERQDKETRDLCLEHGGVVVYRRNRASYDTVDCVFEHSAVNEGDRK